MVDILTYLLIGLYLSAIVAANLSIVYFGPQAAIWNAFILISLDLTSRDALHEKWQGKQLWPRMLILIAAGSLLSWWLNADAGKIALASFVAFALAGSSDAIIYHLLGDKSRLLKMNGSNIVSSTVDTVAFVLIANLPLWVIPGQIIAKIIGGFFWSIILSWSVRRNMRSISNEKISRLA